MKAHYKILLLSVSMVLLGFSNVTAQTTSVYVAAHPDDWQLFMNPNAYTSVKGANEKVIFIHTTAGDGGNGTSSNFYLAREEGSLRAIRFMANTINNTGQGTNMNQTTVTINGHNILKFTYDNTVSYFLRLPDGDYGGQGYPGTGNKSLQKLYNGTISSISAINGSTTYSSLADLENTLKTIVQSEALPSSTLKFNLADDNASINPDDHSDHIHSSLIMQDVANTIGGVTLNLYSEYDTANRAVNVFNDDFMVNAGTWGATSSGISDLTFFGTWESDHNVWLYRQYLRTITSSTTPIAGIAATDPTAAESPLNTGTFTVSLSSVNNTGSAITINYGVSGTATSGSDYIALSGTVSIPNGQQSKTITVTPINDTAVEPVETVIVTITSGTGYSVGTPTAATVNITSEDVATNTATVTATDNAAAESPLDTGKFKITLASTNNTGSAIVINYSLSGTATAGVDYTGLTGSVSIGNGQKSKTITLTPVNDTEVEPTETAILTLTSGTGYTVGSPASATINITSEDVVPPFNPTVSIVASDAYAAESPLDTGSLTVVLSDVNTGPDLTINFNITGTATQGIDYTAFSGTVTFANGQQEQTIIITPINDNEVEQSETVTLNLTSGTGYTVGNPTNATVNIASEDTAPPPPTTNLALNKPTNASLSNERPSARAVDNIYTLDNWWGASPYPQWWSVDLGDAYDLSKLVLFTYYDGNRYYQYDIQGSLDGSTWYTLVDFNANTTPATSSGNTFNLSGPTARYLRVNMNYNSANIGIHIVEFEAYGTLNSANKGGGNSSGTLGAKTTEIFQNYTLSLYPNPNKKGEPIKMDLQLQKEETASVEIFDLLGKKLMDQEYSLKKGFNGIEIPSNHFASGMLIVRVDIGGEITTKKIFIK